MDEFKLVTRRGLAWGIGGLMAATVSFIAVWGAITGTDEFVTLAVGIGGTTIGSILGYYFAKKTSEE
jgi:hypothetical protein